MCTLIQLQQVEQIAKDIFPKNTVNIAPLFRNDLKNLKVLINGIQEFNPISNRRHAWDVMIHYNLYIKKLTDGCWECGEHGDVDDYIIDENPLVAITEFAFRCSINA